MVFYEYVELEDGTQVAYSNVLDDGVVEVSVERPVELGFDSALCTLPALSWTRAEGFDDQELERLNGFLRINAPLIIRLAREVSKEYA